MNFFAMSALLIPSAVRRRISMMSLSASFALRFASPLSFRSPVSQAWRMFSAIVTTSRFSKRLSRLLPFLWFIVSPLMLLWMNAIATKRCTFAKHDLPFTDGLTCRYPRFRMSICFSNFPDVWYSQPRFPRFTLGTERMFPKLDAS